MTTIVSVEKPASLEEVTYLNPTSRPVHVDILDFVGRANVKKRWTWDPGQTMKVPAQYAPAIQDVRNGVIMGGLAPQLVRVDIPEPPKPHSSLAVEPVVVAEPAAPSAAADKKVK